MTYKRTGAVRLTFWQKKKQTRMVLFLVSFLCSVVSRQSCAHGCSSFFLFRLALPFKRSPVFRFFLIKFIRNYFQTLINSIVRFDVIHPKKTLAKGLNLKKAYTFILACTPTHNLGQCADVVWGKQDLCKSLMKAKFWRTGRLNSLLFFETF